MGDHREQFVDLDTSLAAAEGRVEDVRGWLLRAGWSTRTPADDWLFPTAAWVEAGAGFYELIPRLERAAIGVVRATALSEVCWYLGDSTGPADCPRCRTASGEDYWDAVSVWCGLEEPEPEPVLTCAACGFTARVGDWDLGGAVAVGSVAVVVDLSRTGDYDYDRAVGAVLSGLRAGLGGRWAHVHHHL